MKKLYFFLFTLCSFYSFSQAPKLINYQGIVRNASGNPITAPVKIKFEIFPVSSGGTAAFSEIQTTTTNSLGLFSTQIGKVTPLTINWATGSWFLELSVDSTNTGSAFTVVGRQQMVSVPFALFAETAGSAPDPSVTFSNNILYVGTNSVSIPAAPVYTAGNGIAITSGSIINTSTDQIVNISAAGNASVTNAYPNFTVDAQPQVLSINSNSISLSNGGGQIVLPSTSTTPNTSLTASGIATVTTSGTNTFNIAVATPSINGTGGTTVSGTYPNFIISSPTVAAAVTPTITGTGVATTASSGSSYTVNVPGPVLNLGGNVLTITQGTSSSNVVLPVPPPTTVTGSGVAIVTPTTGNNFNVNVPGPSFTYNSSNGQFVLTQGPSNFTGTISPLATLSGTANTLSIGGSTVNLPFWSTNGNSGTSASANYIGTADNTPLSFRTNNQKSGVIDPLLSNAFFGYWAGRDNTTGTQNVAFGTNALLNNTTGTSNLAIGTSALSSNLSGSNNTAVGYSALFTNTGTGNTGTGYFALNANTTGSLNAAYGSYALINNTTGYFNTATGGEALRNNTNGYANTAEGYQAMYWNNGNYNSGFGQGVLQNNTNGIQNTALGSLAGYNNNGSGNVFIGYAAGYNATGSNQLHIGNNTGATPLIFGDFSFGTIGLGTTTPASKLHMVDGSAKLTIESINAGASLSSVDLKTPNAGTASLYKFNTGRLALASGGAYNMQFLNSIGGSFQFDEGSNNRLYIASGGNVGVNTLSPVNLLHVNGGVTITDGSQGAGKVLTSDASGNAAWKPLTVVTTNAFSGKFLSGISSTPILLQSPLCSFTKSAADTRLEIIVQTSLLVGDLIGTNSVLYEVRLNGTSPLANTGRANYYIDNNGATPFSNVNQIALIAEFPNLATGTYNVEIWVSAANAGGTANSVYVDYGNFSASSVIIKEFR